MTYNRSLSMAYKISALQLPHTNSGVLYLVCHRGFAGAEIHKPHRYKNFFNKTKSRDGKFTKFQVWANDFNEPYPLPPVYDSQGDDLNRDPMWGPMGRVPNSTITGKPKRQLGHYPWLGRPIVPADDDRMFIYDDHIAPYPSFRIGKMQYNYIFWGKWAIAWIVFFLCHHIIDIWYSRSISLRHQRDMLYYREQMMQTQALERPIGFTKFGRFDAPIEYAWGNIENWRPLGNHNYLPAFRYEIVFVKGADEDMFPGQMALTY